MQVFVAADVSAYVDLSVKKVTDEERAKIGGYTAKFGTTEAIGHFKQI